MRILVIGSCTAKKQYAGADRSVTESDFATATALQKREQELARWLLPAARMYVGKQHLMTMEGVDVLRREFGASSCTLKIVSAGYGLISEDRVIAPYNLTFYQRPKKEIQEKAAALGIPSSVRHSIRGFDLVFFLLGGDYLCAINPPLEPAANQRLIFFSSTLRTRGDAVVVPAGRTEGTEFGESPRWLKGRMFYLFAKGLIEAPQLWQQLIADASARSALQIIRRGQVRQ